MTHHFPAELSVADSRARALMVAMLVTAVVIFTTGCGAEDGGGEAARSTEPTNATRPTTPAVHALPKAGGPLKPGRYRAKLFNSQVSFSVPDGWRSFGGNTPEFLTVGVSTSPFLAITFIRVTRVVDPASRPLGEVFNRDLLPRPESLADWMEDHPRFATIRRPAVTIAGRRAERVDATPVRPYRNAGCLGVGGCVALFGSEDGTLESIAAQPAGYTVRNYVFDSLGQDFVVGVTAPKKGFATFLPQAERVLAGARFEQP